MRYELLTAAAIIGLSGCVDTSSTNYPALDVLSPENVPVTDSAPVQRPTRPELSYAVKWSCVWDTLPTEWELPGIQIEQGQAYAINEWTRLGGPVRTTAQEGDIVNLTGERLSNDGHWYPMAMEGPIYRDRESTLFGYWKGASCEADVTPVRAEAPSQDATEPS
ncbi:hypothetical protein T8K17_13925 [Thalassobaculum sp. OXR-137]|uniref:hypothetical protein n=1 Tax=Thalassobaculum sp. OXR-137 TaxID=3100173 RepID=UPI002AC90329|nr:hypothetical protein [Thalassobaculum sp. OXR-137]WPZ32338.1 hypothetical protein T8K17_13925 [Thalassobaculum sp. OXR-137]